MSGRRPTAAGASEVTDTAVGGGFGRDRLVFVVRTDNVWWRTTVPASEPARVDVEEVVAALSTSASPPPSLAPNAAHGASDPDLGAVVTPARMFVGLVADGSLVVGNHLGERLALEPDDLRLVDLLEGPTSVADLERCLCDRPDLLTGARLARLAAAGAVRIDA